MRIESYKYYQASYRGFSLIRHSSGNGAVTVYTCLGHQVKKDFPSVFAAQQAVDSHHKQDGQSLTP